METPSAEISKRLDYDDLIMRMNEFIANHKYYIRDKKGLQDEISDLIIKSCFAYHYENNKFYRDFCTDQSVTPEIVFNEGIERIPLLPIKLFKDQNSHLLLTKKISQIEFELRSTGTSGIPSVSRRDKDTVDIICTAFSSMYRDFLQIITGCGLFLCPSPAEVPEMGMVKAFNYLSGMFDDRIYLVEKYTFSSADAIKILEKWQDKFDRYVLGPPFMIFRLLQYMQNNNIKIQLDKKSKIIMLGGWKRFSGEQISRESFDEMCIEYLGVEKQQIRDMYGLAECNFLAIECEKGHKHVPAWVKLIIKDLDDNSKIVTKLGKSGVIGIIDPTVLSYPCFVLTEDVGRIDNDETCECGRKTQVMSFQRRVTGAELGCCAINMEKYMTDETIERSCMIEPSQS